MNLYIQGNSKNMNALPSATLPMRSSRRVSNKLKAQGEPSAYSNSIETNGIKVWSPPLGVTTPDSVRNGSPTCELASQESVQSNTFGSERHDQNIILPPPPEMRATSSSTSNALLFALPEEQPEIRNSADRNDNPAGSLSTHRESVSIQADSFVHVESEGSEEEEEWSPRREMEEVRSHPVLLIWPI